MATLLCAFQSGVPRWCQSRLLEPFCLNYLREKKDGSLRNQSRWKTYETKTVSTFVKCHVVRFRYEKSLCSCWIRTQLPKRVTSSLENDGNGRRWEGNAQNQRDEPLAPNEQWFPLLYEQGVHLSKRNYLLGLSTNLALTLWETSWNFKRRSFLSASLIVDDDKLVRY